MDTAIGLLYFSDYQRLEVVMKHQLLILLVFIYKTAMTQPGIEQDLNQLYQLK